MVPKFYGPQGKSKKVHGTSFKGLAEYLLHDNEKAKTQDRVKWTHTLNLASDDPEMAVHEMLWTYRAAEDLKRAAGVKAGGRPLTRPVRHFSLNWHPSESPTREHMIETVESFLKHLNLSEAQALIVNHDDKKHAHVHVMYNAVHPVTGRAFDDAFCKRAAQKWALEYEREQGRIFCEERLKPYAERTPSPTRETWEQLRSYEREDDRAELGRISEDFLSFDRKSPENFAAKEWSALKAYQRSQRQQFFAEGKEAYRDVRTNAYREVRAEFRHEWSEFFAAQRNGLDGDELAALKADICARQKAALDERRKEACQALRGERDEEYAALLKRHQEERRELTERQCDGQRSYHLLDTVYPAAPNVQQRDATNSAHENPRRTAFAHTAQEICQPSARTAQVSAADDARDDHKAHDEQPMFRQPSDAGLGIGLGVIGAVAKIGERLFDGFFGGGEAPKRRQPEIQRQPTIDKEQVAAQRAVTAQAANEARETEEAKDRSWWERRRSRGRGRD